METGHTAHSRKVRQVILGGLIVVATVAALFWWGFHFQVFGSAIDWLGQPAQLGFPALIAVGAFGAGYCAGGRNTGLKALAWAAGLMLAAILLGIVRKAI